jgi:glycosyltransferase involved in cell wall biosynthesis
MPPVAGGAVEKSWHRLTEEFARRGHEVTLVSRQWKDWPKQEIIGGVRHLRLPGYDHKQRLWQNLWCDFIWSLRVHRNLPDADIVALNTISLACWLGWLRPKAGRVIVMPGRMPKGQFRLYRRPARVLVPSQPVRDAVVLERPTFRELIHCVGYPIDWQAISRTKSTPNAWVTIGYVGRINQEKGLHLLIAALQKLAVMDLPPWRAIICGPADVARGGSGPAYLEHLRQSAPTQVEFREPIYEEAGLFQLYRQFGIFCYPSLAAQGETFGVSVAEAMAAGAVPVVTNLPCFLDFVRPGQTGLTFEATAPDAVNRMTEQFVDLITQPERRHAMGRQAQAAVAQYDFDVFADRLLADFAQLTAEPKTTS